MAPGANEESYLTEKSRGLAKPTGKGFTLVELLVALAVLVIMATVAVPSFQRMMARNEVAAEVMRIRTAINFARNAAISRRKAVTVCPTVNTLECSEDWSLPLMVFEEEADYGARENHEPLLKISESGKTQNNFNGFSSDSRITYQPLGTAFGYNGTISICKDREHGASIIINMMGRQKSQPNNVSDC